ncbi:hypothetical protein FOZ62_013066, partial [Perkinsus olseni]
MSTSLCREERQLAAANNGARIMPHEDHTQQQQQQQQQKAGDCPVQHPTITSPQWLVIRLTPELLNTDSSETVSCGKFQINLSWRDKTPIRKLFTFLRRRRRTVTPQRQQQQLYLRWGGHIMATEAMDQAETA